jgi:hypothetical protein
VIFIVLTSCNQDPKVRDSKLEYVVVDSGLQVDTSEDTSVPEGAITLSPQGGTILTKSTIMLRATYILNGALPEELTPMWTSSDETVISIDGSTAYGLAAGSATLTAQTTMGDASIDITVEDPETLTVHVYDPKTQNPISGITVALNGAPVSSTSSDGSCELSITSRPESLSIYQSGYIPVSLLEINTDTIFLPALTNTQTQAPSLPSSGSIDFSELPSADFDEVPTSITIPDFQSILSVSIMDIFQGTRAVELFGTEADIPASLSLDGYDNTYVVYSDIEDPSIHTFATNVPISTYTDAANTTNPIELLADLIPNMQHATGLGGTLQPDTPLSTVSGPSLGSVPIEFQGVSPILFYGRNNNSVFSTCGLSVYENSTQIYSSQSSGCDTADTSVAVLFEMTENSYHTSSVIGQGQQLQNFLSSPELVFFDFNTKETELLLDPNAQIAQVWIQAADGSQRIIYLPTHSTSFELPMPPVPMGYGNTTWRVQQIQLNTGTYTELLSQPGFEFIDATNNSFASSLLNRHIVQ